MSSREIIFTNEARCRDCYRCVRVCPVKAVGWKDGQAYVEEERCIYCGTCIKECPQNAKVYRNDVYQAKSLLQKGVTAISIAPSFAGLFPEWMLKRLPSALRQLGFSIVGETAVGVTYHLNNLIKKTNLSSGRFVLDSSCPAFIEFAEKYEPDLVKYITKIPSPMVLHAIHLRQKFSHVENVVFAGPCIAKKKESERPEFSNLINAVLTFEELIQWLEEENIDLKSCEESDFDDRAEGLGPIFPVANGLEKIVKQITDQENLQIESINGEKNIIAYCDYIKSNESEGCISELMWCSNGCIGGPAAGTKTNPFTSKKRIMDLAGQNNILNMENIPHLQFPVICLQVPENHESESITDKNINTILNRMGKSQPEDELNCGACGYNSCRDKAVAVLKGIAQIEMCMPYMRFLAEQRSDKIIETSPNGILILDKNLSILKINPSFKNMFRCSDAVVGKQISYLMDREPFEKVLYGEVEFLEGNMELKQYDLVLHHIIYQLFEEKQLVAIFVNITNQIHNKELLERLKKRSLVKAQELLDHQIRMAQEMAKFLGEQTATGEMLVDNLMKLVNNQER